MLKITGFNTISFDSDLLYFIIFGLNICSVELSMKKIYNLGAWPIPL